MSNRQAISDLASEETRRANLAEWRASAIRELSRGLTHLWLAYEGNDAVLQEIAAMREQYTKVFQGRAEKLDEIAVQSRRKAALGVEELTNE